MLKVTSVHTPKRHTAKSRQHIPTKTRKQYVVRNIVESGMRVVQYAIAYHKAVKDKLQIPSTFIAGSDQHNPRLPENIINNAQLIDKHFGYCKVKSKRYLITD